MIATLYKEELQATMRGHFAWLGAGVVLLALGGVAAAATQDSWVDGYGIIAYFLVPLAFIPLAAGVIASPRANRFVESLFTAPVERAKAFAVYGAIAGSGAAAGMLLGGVLTEYLTWRWCLYVNVPIAAAAAAGGWAVLKGGAAAGRHGFDIPGALLGTGGLVALVYACTRAVGEGWSSASVLALLAASGVLLVLFVLRQSRAAQALLPLRIVLDRNRGGAYLAVALGLAGMFGAFLFLTYYLQVVLHFSPVQAGLAFLPMTLASQAASWLIARRLMPRLQPRALMAPGALVAAAGMALLTQLQTDSAYLALVLPAELLLGAGTACVMVPAFSVGTLGVDRREAGAAAATVNTAQQVGGSLGTALLNTIAASATASYLVERSPGLATAAALVHGYQAATLWGTAILLAGALLSALMVNATPPPAEQVARPG